MTLLAALVWTVVAQAATVVPLSGTVVDDGGNPVAGVELVLIDAAGPDALFVGHAIPRVVARAKSDARGRFTLDRPASLKGDVNSEDSPVLWAAKPGLRIAATRFRGELPGPDEPLRVVLEPPGRARVRVEGPDGRPVGGAVVLPARLWSHRTYLPDEIAENDPATTDERGVAVLNAVAQDAMADVQVRTREYGSQVWWTDNPTDTTITVPLRPAATWQGRLTAKDPAHRKGWKVRAWTWLGGNLRDRGQTLGRAKAVADEEGRFTLAPIADGTLRLELEPPGDLPVLPNLPGDLAVVRGREQSCDIPLQRPVMIAGRILERGTGRAIEGARVFLSDAGPVRSWSRETWTGPDGRYAFRAFPGKLEVLALPPDSHVSGPESLSEELEVAEGAGPVQIKTWEVTRAAPPFRGEVRDEAGRLVADADVQIEWRAKVAGAATSDRILGTADEAGGFVIKSLPPDATVTIMASHRGRRTQPPHEARSGVEGPVKVVITPMPLMAAVGKVTAPTGTRLGGIQVRISFRPGKGAPEDILSGRFALNSYAAITSTEPDGSFRTPKEIERMPGEFCAQVYDSDLTGADSEWIPTPDGELLRFPDLPLTPARARPREEPTASPK